MRNQLNYPALRYNGTFRKYPESTSSGTILTTSMTMENSKHGMFNRLQIWFEATVSPSFSASKARHLSYLPGAFQTSIEWVLCKAAKNICGEKTSNTAYNYKEPSLANSLIRSMVRSTPATDRVVELFRRRKLSPSNPGTPPANAEVKTNSPLASYESTFYACIRHIRVKIPTYCE